MYANVLLLTCAWGIVTVIAGNQLKGETVTLMFGLLLIGIAIIVLTLVLTSLHVPKEKKASFCWKFTKYGLCLFVKYFIIFSIILIPIWYLMLSEGMERRITETGKEVYVEYLGDGKYRDNYGNTYKEK